MLSLIIGSNKIVGLVFWIGVIVSITILELLGHVRSNRFPTLSSLIRHYFASPSVRLLTIGLWLFAGWHLFSH